MIIRPRGIDSTIKLYLPFIGADAATFIKDYSQNHRAVTVVGNAQLDTAQYKFPPSSLLLDGTGDYLTCADSADWAFGSSPFTLHLWFRANALPGSGTTHYLISQYQNATNVWAVYIYNNAGSYQLNFYQKIGGTLSDNLGAVTNPNLAINTWYHFAFVRLGTAWHWFQGGASINSGATEFDTAIADNTGLLYLGQLGDGTAYANGWLAEVVIRKGAARWTAAFTPPTRRLL